MFTRFFLVIHLFLFTAKMAQALDKQIAPKVTKIVAIHSYADDFPWTHMIKEAFSEELKHQKLTNEIKHFYFDVKKHPLSGTNPHPLLSEIESELKQNPPQAILISDDFALNQMSDLLLKYQIPFVFAGINGAIPTKITKSPWKQYTGVFERYYIADSIHLLQKLLNRKKLKVLFLLEDSETSQFVAEYTKRELKSLPEITYDFLITNDFAEWQSKVLDSKLNYDAFAPLQPYALKKANGEYLPPMEVVKWFYEKVNRPTVYTGEWQIRCGGTLAIALRPRAQGRVAAQLVSEVLRQNKFSPPISPPEGDIAINYIATQRLNIKVPFDLLTTATIERKVDQPCNPN